jgi:hypothetical protein
VYDDGPEEFQSLSNIICPRLILDQEHMKSEEVQASNSDYIKYCSKELDPIYDTCEMDYENRHIFELVGTVFSNV